MLKTESFIQVEVTSITQLRQWLKVNHTQKESVWLLLHKKSSCQFYIPKIKIIDELLCFGWIDGLARKVNEHTYLLLVSPRRAQHWAESYKKRIKILEDKNRMADAGIKAVQKSKQNGTWNFMDDVDALIKPLDFVKRLNDNPPAKINFDRFSASSKRFMLRYIKIAKTETTRQKRINLVTQLAKQNKKLPNS